jgi:hypothetical protein
MTRHVPKMILAPYKIVVHPVDANPLASRAAEIRLPPGSLWERSPPTEGASMPSTRTTRPSPRKNALRVANPPGGAGPRGHGGLTQESARRSMRGALTMA